jgi:hypothetical protein
MILPSLDGVRYTSAGIFFFFSYQDQSAAMYTDGMKKKSCICVWLGLVLLCYTVTPWLFP